MKYFSGVLIAALIGMTIFSVNALKPSTLTAHIVFLVLLLMPYLLFALALWREAPERKRRSVSIAIICLLSLFALVDTLYIHPDAQGGLFIFMLPFLQGALYGIVMLFGMLIQRRRASEFSEK